MCDTDVHRLQAEALYSRVVALERERQHRKTGDGIALCNALCRLADCQRRLSRLQLAVSSHEAALCIHEQLGEAAHACMISVLNHLAAVRTMQVRVQCTAACMVQT